MIDKFHENSEHFIQSSNNINFHGRFKMPDASRLLYKTQIENQMNLPHNKEVVAINVPWLHSVFWIFKNKLSITSEISSHDRSLKVGSTTSGVIWDASKGENSRDIEVVRKFKRSISRDKGHTIDSISLLAINNWSRALKSNCMGCVDQSIMVRALRIRSWATCS